MAVDKPYWKELDEDNINNIMGPDPCVREFGIPGQDIPFDPHDQSNSWYFKAMQERQKRLEEECAYLRADLDELTQRLERLEKSQ